MPAFRFDGTARDYPFTRDAQGQNLGRVEPGDEREFEQAPDQWWVPAEPGSGEDAPGDGRDPGGASEGDAPPPPVPAPPAVIPGA